jgi:hypothetical protein
MARRLGRAQSATSVNASYVRASHLCARTSVTERARSAAFWVGTRPTRARRAKPTATARAADIVGAHTCIRVRPTLGVRSTRGSDPPLEPAKGGELTSWFAAAPAPLAERAAPPAGSGSAIATALRPLPVARTLCRAGARRNASAMVAMGRSGPPLNLCYRKLVLPSVSPWGRLLEGRLLERCRVVLPHNALWLSPLGRRRRQLSSWMQ